MYRFLVVVLLSICTLPALSQEIFLPIEVLDRNDIGSLRLTAIGEYGLERKARPSVLKHLHTGIDIKRPRNNYKSEPIYPIAEGIVISKRDDGPFAQLIVAHEVKGEKFWTVYEHISGIIPQLYDVVSPENPIARFMNKGELNKYGWQFDHFHFEILKKEPMSLAPTLKTPERLFNSFTLVCFDPEDLGKHFFNPIEFLDSK